MSGQLAARVDDEVGAHAGEGGGFRTLMSALEFGAVGAAAAGLVVAAVAAAPAVLAGATVGAVLTAAGGGVATLGGAAAVAGGLLSGAAQGIGLQRAKEEKKVGGGCSKIHTGSEDVFIEGKAAARAGEDDNAHGDVKLRQGSDRVFVNGRPLTRRGDASRCGGKVVTSAARTHVGGEPTDVGGPTVDSRSGLDRVDWGTAETTLGIAGMLLGAGAIGNGAVNVVRNAGGIMSVVTTTAGAAKAAIFGTEVGGGFALGQKLHDAGDTLGSWLSGAQGAVTGALVGEGLANAFSVSRFAGATKGLGGKIGNWFGHGAAPAAPHVEPGASPALPAAPTETPASDVPCASCEKRDAKRPSPPAPADGLNAQLKSGARWGSINERQARDIQAFADRRGTVIVVGSRARGEAGPLSDFDYVVANSAAKQKANGSRNGPNRAPGLPRGAGGGEETASGQSSGRDVFTRQEWTERMGRSLGDDQPQIVFEPRASAASSDGAVPAHARVERPSAFRPEPMTRPDESDVSQFDRYLEGIDPSKLKSPPQPEDASAADPRSAMRARREQVRDEVQSSSTSQTYRQELSQRRAIEQAEAAARAQGWSPTSKKTQVIDLEYEGEPRFFSLEPTTHTPAGWTVLRVHGDPTGFESRPLPFGGTGRAQPRSLDELATLLSKTDGPILLESCSTGRPIPFENPVAQKLADHPLLKGRTIVAPTREIGGPGYINGTEGRWFAFRAGKKWYGQTREDALAEIDDILADFRPPPTTPEPTLATGAEAKLPAEPTPCASCSASSSPPRASEVKTPPPPEDPAKVAARQAKLRGVPDAAIDASGPGGTFVAPADAVPLVENAWQKVLSFEKRNNAGQPLPEETRAALFDGFMSRNLTPFGPARADRAAGHRLFMLDDPFLASANVPDAIKQRVTIDHHHPLFTSPKGPGETTSMQLLGRAVGGDPRLVSDGTARIHWSSGNVNDGASDGSFFLMNAARFKADPEATERALAVSDWIDNKNFQKVPLLHSDAPPGSDTEAALAVMRVNDLMTKAVGTPAADRLAVPSPSGGVITLVPKDKITAAIPDAHAKLDGIFFDRTPAGQAERTRLANEQRDTLKQALGYVDEGVVDIGDYGGQPSGVLVYDSTELNAENLGQLAAWRVVPEKAMALEAATPGRSIVRSVDFAQAGSDALGPKTKYFIGSLGAKQSLEPLVPLVRQAEVDARVKLLAKVKDDPEKVAALEKEIQALQSGGGAVASKLPFLVFAPGGSRMTKEDMIAFLKDPRVREILESRPPPSAAEAPPKPPPCPSCAAPQRARWDGREGPLEYPEIPPQAAAATPEQVAQWWDEKGDAWRAYNQAVAQARMLGPDPPDRDMGGDVRRNPNIVRVFETPNGPYKQVRLAGRRNLDPSMNIVQPLPGVTDVFIHGNGKQFEVQRWSGERGGPDGSHTLARGGKPMSGWQLRVASIDPKDGMQKLSPEHLASVLRRMGVTGDVRLISCYGGRVETDEGAAVRFARAWGGSGDRVYAYDTAVNHNAIDGRVEGQEKVLDPITGQPEEDQWGVPTRRTRNVDPGLKAFDVSPDGGVTVSRPSADDIAARSGGAPRADTGS